MCWLAEALDNTLEFLNEALRLGTNLAIQLRREGLLSGYISYSGNMYTDHYMLLIVSLAILLSVYLYDMCGCLAILVIYIEHSKRWAKDFTVLSPAHTLR